jgi:hypothetical protein
MALFGLRTKITEIYLFYFTFIVLFIFRNPDQSVHLKLVFLFFSKCQPSFFGHLACCTHLRPGADPEPSLGQTEAGPESTGIFNSEFWLPQHQFANIIKSDQVGLYSSRPWIWVRMSFRLICPDLTCVLSCVFCSRNDIRFRIHERLDYKLIWSLDTIFNAHRWDNNGSSNKFIFRASYGNSIVCNIFPA